MSDEFELTADDSVLPYPDAREYLGQMADMEWALTTGDSQKIEVHAEGNKKVWEGTWEEYGQLLEAIQTRQPVPWCVVHNCCMVVLDDGEPDDQCHWFSSDWNFDGDCHLEDPPTRWRTAVVPGE